MMEKSIDELLSLMEKYQFIERRGTYFRLTKIYYQILNSFIDNGEGITIAVTRSIRAFEPTISKIEVAAFGNLILDYLAGEIPGMDKQITLERDILVNSALFRKVVHTAPKELRSLDETMKLIKKIRNDA